MVCCFSSYINFTAYRTLNSLRYSWLHVTYSVFLLCSMSGKKLLLKGKFFLKRQSQNAKQVGVLQNIWDEDYFHFSHSSEDGKKWTKMGRPRCWAEKGGGSVDYFDAIVSASAKIYLLLSKECLSFFSVVWSVHFSLTFFYAILTSYHSLSWLCS